MSATTLKLNPPFRAEQIGSLKRPQALLEKRKEFEAGKCTQEELRVVEDEAIKAVVQVQRETGIKGITDGEFRRCVFSGHLAKSDRNGARTDTCSTTACSTTWTA